MPVDLSRSAVRWELQASPASLDPDTVALGCLSRQRFRGVGPCRPVCWSVQDGCGLTPLLRMPAPAGTQVRGDAGTTGLHPWLRYAASCRGSGASLPSPDFLPQICLRRIAQGARLVQASPWGGAVACGPKYLCVASLLEGVLDGTLIDVLNLATGEDKHG